MINRQLIISFCQSFLFVVVVQSFSSQITNFIITFVMLNVLTLIFDWKKLFQIDNLIFSKKSKSLLSIFMSSLLLRLRLQKVRLNQILIINQYRLSRQMLISQKTLKSTVSIVTEITRKLTSFYLKKVNQNLFALILNQKSLLWIVDSFFVRILIFLYVLWLHLLRYEKLSLINIKLLSTSLHQWIFLIKKWQNRQDYDSSRNSFDEQSQNQHAHWQ